MTTTQRGILTLIGSALSGQPQPLPGDFSLEQAAGIIQRHNIIPLVCEGAALCGISMADPVMARLFQRSCAALMTGERQLKHLGRLFAAFEEAGVDYMPLKGAKMKPRYPRQGLRTMGDADVLIRVEQYDTIVPILQRLGYEEVVESDHELVWKRPGLYLELHKRLIPSYNKDLYAWFGDGWRLARPEKGRCYGMKPEDEWIYIFSHFAKHYRDGGIGCRHVADLWVFRRCFPDMDENDIRAQLEGLGLSEFYGHTCRLLEYWFHSGAGDDRLELMTEYIFSSGSFGTSDSRMLSQMLCKVENSALGAGGRFLLLWNSVFPPMSALRQEYPVLKKRPWLLPGVWLVRPFHRMWKNPGVLRRKRKALRLISEDRLDHRRQSLRLVGLDYNF